MKTAIAVLCAYAVLFATSADGSGVIHRGTFDLSSDLFKTDKKERMVVLGMFGYSESGVFKIEVEDPEGMVNPAMLTGSAPSTENNGVGFLLSPTPSRQYSLNEKIDAATLCTPGKLEEAAKEAGDFQREFKRIKLFKVSEGTTTTDAPRTDAPTTDVPANATTGAPDTDTPAAARHGVVLEGESAPPQEVVLPVGERVKNTKYVGEVKNFLGMPGFWQLIVYRCLKQSDDPKALGEAGLKVRITEKGDPSTYLQIGDVVLPQVYVVLSLAFFVALAKWVHWMQQNKEHLHKIHFLMGVAVMLKACATLFEALRYYYYSEHGDMFALYETMYYMFTILKGALVFSLVVLIGSGWSFLKPFLADKDKKILMTVIPLQVVVTITQIILDEKTAGKAESNYANWQKVFTFLSFICCVIVIAPVLGSLKQLRSAQNTEGKVARNLARLKQFRTLYAVVIIYLYFKMIVCEMVLVSFVSYTNTWLPVVLAELSVLGSFVYMGIKFRPMKENPYIHLDEDDLEEGGAALDQELEEMAKSKQAAESSHTVQGGARCSTEEREKAPPSLSTLAPAKRPTEADF